VTTTTTTTSTSTSTILLGAVVEVTVTSTLSTYTSTQVSWRTASELVTLTSTTTKIAPLWYTQDYAGLAVLGLGVFFGACTVIIYRKVRPRGLAESYGAAAIPILVYVAIAVGLCHPLEAGIQYMLGCPFVILGACLAEWKKRNSSP
jgi:hypothetical protein